MCFEIVDAADRVVQCAVGIEIDRIDRKVAARRIFGPIGIEGDARPSAVSLDIPPQCRDLEMPRLGCAHDRGDRAVLDAGRDRLDPRFFERGDDLLRARRRRDVDIGDGAAEQRVTDAAAHKARHNSGLRQRRDDGAGLWRRHPGLRRDGACLAPAHRRSPITAAARHGRERSGHSPSVAAHRRQTPICRNAH